MKIGIAELSILTSKGIAQGIKKEDFSNHFNEDKFRKMIKKGYLEEVESNDGKSKKMYRITSKGVYLLYEALLNIAGEDTREINNEFISGMFIGDPYAIPCGGNFGSMPKAIKNGFSQEIYATKKELRKIEKGITKLGFGVVALKIRSESYHDDRDILTCLDIILLK